MVGAERNGRGGKQLPNEIVYGKPQCEKCHLPAKMSGATGKSGCGRRGSRGRDGSGAQDGVAHPTG